MKRQKNQKNNNSNKYNNNKIQFKIWIKKKMYLNKNILIQLKKNLKLNNKQKIKKN